MKRLTTLLLSGVFFVAAPISTAPAQTNDTQEQEDDSDPPYGLLGLLGLAGLAGLKKRNDHHDDHVRTTTGSTATRP